jgi:hypothetical protein
MSHLLIGHLVHANEFLWRASSSISITFNDLAGLLVPGKAAHKGPRDHRHCRFGSMHHVVDPYKSQMLSPVNILNVDHVVFDAIHDLERTTVIRKAKEAGQVVITVFSCHDFVASLHWAPRCGKTMQKKRRAASR